MSLSNRLKEANTQAGNILCKVGSILVGNKITKEEKTQLEAILQTPRSYPGRVSSSELNKIFREEGLDVSISSFDRHRAERCSCVRNIKQ